MTVPRRYPIGVPGVPWGEAEREAWRARQNHARSYSEDIVPRISGLAGRFDVIVYGQLDYAGDRYDLFAVKSRPVEPGAPVVLITGGVHGYETSGVLGALDFLDRHAADYVGRANLIVAPCVSPWSYERRARWNFDAVDPNRSFRDGGASPEAAALMALVQSSADRYLLHIDLHETTDSDESEFRPALSARDGAVFEPGGIPDGFYLVADATDLELDFQQAVLSAVETVTHIAPPDDQGQLFGAPVVAPGVAAYAASALGLCMAITKAPFRTTTEVYPDSLRTTPDACIRAQAVAVCAALDHALASGRRG